MSGTNNGMKKRWISLYVENQVGVLSKISGLFSGKSYNLDSLTVGTTEDPTISRMTIATVSDDETFEQIKKQLNRMVEVIKVIDFTDVFVRMKEILYMALVEIALRYEMELSRNDTKPYRDVISQLTSEIEDALKG